MERFARALELTTCYIAIAVLLMLASATAPVPALYAGSAAAANSVCTAPTFFSLTITAANLNTPWSLPLLSTLDGEFAPVVTAKGLPPGVTLQDQKTTLTAGGSTLHNWVLAGAPNQLGTYTITVTAQNSCGGASTLITLPINNAPTAQGQVCPAGMTGTYPNCSLIVAATAATTSTTVATSTAAPAAAPPRTTSAAVILPSANSAAALAQKNSTQCAALPAMQQGGSGTAVAALQQFLIAQGLLPAGSATGFFGPKTHDAVGAYQLQQGIVSSVSSAGYGTVGPSTHTALQMAMCGNTTSAAPIQRLSCPKLVIPACPGGSPVAVGVDTHGCTYGYKCVASPGGTTAGCPNVKYPTCSNGNVISLGSDINGCSLGYYCQAVSCFSSPIITSCPAGQTLVSGTDKYGCPNVSYCTGGGGSSTNTTGTNTTGNTSSFFGNLGSYFGSFGSTFSDYFSSLFGGSSNIAPITTMPIQQVAPPAAPVSGSASDANAAYIALFNAYGSATITKCTQTNGTVTYIVNGFNSNNTVHETRTFPPGIQIASGTCQVTGTIGPQPAGSPFTGVDTSGLGSSGASGAASASGSSGSGNGSGDAGAASDAGAAASAGTGEGF